MPRSSASKTSMAAGECDRSVVARRRAQWIKYQGRVETEQLVFIDETWTRTDMAPLRGWGSRGHRLPGKVPHGRWKTMTFLAALRHDRIDAPWFIEGPIGDVSFRTYVEKVLLPVLRPGDIVVLDNLGSHRSSRRQAVLPANILARPEPDRTGLCQAQASAPKGRRTNRGRGLRSNRPRTRCLQPRGMRQLPQKFGISNLMPSCFNPDLASGSDRVLRERFQGSPCTTARQVSRGGALDPMFAL